MPVPVPFGKRESAPAGRQPWAHLRIPPFPQIAMRILHLTESENSSMAQLSKLISSEPAFSSEVLAIANSALYATRFPITSVLQAVAILGMDRLKGVCLTVGIRAFLGKALNDRMLRGVWRHSLACALVAQQLAEAGPLDSDAAYSAGIMHDVGRLALAVISPKPYAELLGRHHGSSASILEAERALFGFDHCEAGSRLVSEWNLPAHLSPIVSAHHAPRSGQSWQLPDLINFSCRIADSIGFAVFPGCEIPVYSELLEELPDRERQAFFSDSEQLAFEISRKINGAEVA
jgi:putative nucleotidyltransferase with HDIG domain